jgi:hypothetical protein
LRNRIRRQNHHKGAGAGAPEISGNIYLGATLWRKNEIYDAIVKKSLGFSVRLVGDLNISFSDNYKT